jgi:putative ATP-binding cassette transporter
MMALILRELPHATIISVGHRPELEAFHGRKLTIARRPGGARIVSDVIIHPRASKPAPATNRSDTYTQERLAIGA